MLALLSVTLIILALQGCQVARSQPPATNVASIIPPVPDNRPDFDAEIKPIFQRRCQPCHFQGGKVYQNLPFDNSATITKLGTKLFTRIKEDKEQALIHEFLVCP